MAKHRVAGIAVAIGMRHLPSLARVRFALYRDDATRTKITETTPQPVGPGRTEVAAQHEILMTVGRYWVAGTVDATTNISWSQGAVADVVAIQGQLFTASFPNDLTGTSPLQGKYAVFLELAYSSGL